MSRFYGGPIDRAQVGMNEWPIDENFIDYTIGNPKGGLINDPAAFPQITPPALASADEKGVETVSTGFHAVEFLLWGQRADQREGPGTRPYTDYVDGGTAANQDRRRAYLSAATSMLLDDMRGLEAEWDLADKNSYASRLVTEKPHDALTKIFRGFSQMAISELFYERLFDPVISLDRKDEESCFSESTHNDLVANALSVEGVYIGRYRTSDGTVLEGPSLSDLCPREGSFARRRAPLAAQRRPRHHRGHSASLRPRRPRARPARRRIAPFRPRSPRSSRVQGHARARRRDARHRSTTLWMRRVLRLGSGFSSSAALLAACRSGLVADACPRVPAPIPIARSSAARARSSTRAPRRSSTSARNLSQVRGAGRSSSLATASSIGTGCPRLRASAREREGPRADVRRDLLLGVPRQPRGRLLEGRRAGFVGLTLPAQRAREGPPR